MPIATDSPDPSANSQTLTAASRRRWQLVYGAILLLLAVEILLLYLLPEFLR